MMVVVLTFVKTLGRISVLSLLMFTCFKTITQQFLHVQGVSFLFQSKVSGAFLFDLSKEYHPTETNVFGGASGGQGR
jgi:hypothetical protein